MIKKWFSRKPVDGARATTCALVNQLATPGLGSLMAGRLVAGTGQLLIALMGCCMMMIWLVSELSNFYGLINGGNGEGNTHRIIGGIGAFLLIVSWLWSLVTSISLLREAKRNEATLFENNPQSPT